MTRLHLIGAGAVVLIIAAIGIWWLIDSRARLSVEADRLNGQIETMERMDEVDTDFGDCPWHRRLLSDCE